MSKSKSLPEFLKDEAEGLQRYGWSVTVSDRKPEYEHGSEWAGWEFVKVSASHFEAGSFVVLNASKAPNGRWTLGYCSIGSGFLSRALNSRKAISEALFEARLFTLTSKAVRS